MWDRREIHEAAASRHGLIDRETILELGGTDHSIQNELDRGKWKQTHPGVYYLNVTPLTWRTRVCAAVLAGGARTLASHRTAALLWELDGIFGSIIEITAPHSDRPIPEGVIVHRTRRRLPSAAVDSIPVTTVERTLLDLAAIVPDRVLEKAMMSALHRRLTTIEAVDQTLGTEGGRGVKGTRRLRRVLALAEAGITASVAEVDLAAIIRGAPVPSPQTQLQVRLPDGSNAYPDFAWVDRMKLVEADGYGSHSTPEQLDRDLTRQNQLMELGWQVRRFSARQIAQEPLIVRDELVRFVNA